MRLGRLRIVGNARVVDVAFKSCRDAALWFAGRTRTVETDNLAVGIDSYGLSQDLTRQFKSRASYHNLTQWK